MSETFTEKSTRTPPPGMLQDNFTLLDVGAAVSKQLDLPPGSLEVAGLAGKLHSFVNADPAFRTSGLDGASFRTLVISNITPEIARALDPGQAAALRKEQQQAGVGRPDNPFALGSAQRSMINGVLVGDGDKTAPGYGSLTLNQMQKAALDIVNKYAELGWVRNNAELLNLGPSAIQALADVHLRQDSYERFKQGGLSTQGIVAGARWAKKNGVDYNEFSESYGATQGQLSESDKKEHNKAVERYYTAPGATEQERETSKKEFNDNMDAIKKRNPNAAPQIEHEQKVLKTQLKKEQMKNAKATTAKSENDDLMASLNSPARVASKTAAVAASASSKTDASKPKTRQASAAPKPGTGA